MAMKHEGVILDADHQGTILVELAEFHEFVLEAWHSGERENGQVAQDLYALGNMEGRCICNNLCQDDLDTLDEWNEEVAEWKEWHDGQIS